MKRLWLAVTAYLVLTGCTSTLYRDKLDPPRHKVGDVLCGRWQGNEDSRVEILDVQPKDRIYKVREVGGGTPMTLTIYLTEYLYKPVKK